MRPENDLGALLGGYRLEEQIGAGSVGVVYRARRGRDGAPVALKWLRQELARDRLYRRRLEHEVRIAANVRHRNLIPVIDTGEARGRPYLVSRYVDGRSLAARLQAQGEMPVAAIVGAVTDIAAGLGALHRHGLVHRDVKPANVMVGGDGGALLTDFGLAKGPAYTSLTKTGQLVGTVDYLAPEIIEGGEGTPAGDVYALACVAFECLARRPPFRGGSALEVAYCHLEVEPPDPCAGRAGIAPEVSQVVRGALAKDPAGRPRSATMFAHLLRTAAGS